MHPWAVRILKCREVPLTQEDRREAWSELLGACRETIQDQRRRVSSPEPVDRETIRVDCLRIYNDQRDRVEQWLADHWVSKGMPYMQGFHFVAQFALAAGLSDDDVAQWISLFGLRAYMPMDRIELTVKAPDGIIEPLYVRNLGPMNAILDQFWSILATRDPELTSHLERFCIVFPALIPCYVSLFTHDVGPVERQHVAAIWDDMIALESVQCGLGTLYITSLLTLLLESQRESLLACQDDAQIVSILSTMIASHLEPRVHLTLACCRALASPRV